MTHRHPGLLPKTLTTLDVLSGGRAWLDTGAPLPEGVSGHSVDEAVERLGRLGAGIDHVIRSTADTTDPQAYEKAAEVRR